MKIGVDISSLQGPHRMRGIGYTASNFISHLSPSKDEEFVFYLEQTEKNVDDIIELITIKPDQFELRYFEHTTKKETSSRLLRPYVKVIAKLQALSVYKSGDPKYPNIGDIDCFIQLDQSQPLPKSGVNTMNMFVAYDLIPYIMESDYLHNYRTSRKLGKSRKASLKAAFDRYVYIKKVRLNVQRADKILAISRTTKKDFIRLANAKEEKIDVITLGVTSNNESSIKQQDEKSRTIERYEKTSWGYFPHKSELKPGSFLLFVGGADNRRRLQDLVTAFNHLRATGKDAKLVLSGDIMQGPLNIPNLLVQKALLGSSYADDIYYLGFTDDETRDWLYQHALAFVFPSVYEGFGLPVLEAMGRGTPVVCYKNGAVEELTDDIPLFASDAQSLSTAILKVCELSPSELKKLRLRGIKQANRYTWDITATQIFNSVNPSSKSE